MEVRLLIPSQQPRRRCVVMVKRASASVLSGASRQPMRELRTASATLSHSVALNVRLTFAFDQA